MPLLEQMTQWMMMGNDAQRNEAQNCLTALKEHLQAWTVVATILEKTSNESTKFFGLQILEEAIKFRWKVLPEADRGGVKTYIVGLCIEQATAPNRSKAFLNKANLILVQVLKQEWPHNWPQFIPEIVASSKSGGPELCENNMHILRLLSEEIFDFSADQMTTAKIDALKKQLNSEFSQVFELCKMVLDHAGEGMSHTLITATLQTLRVFLNWIPLMYIFDHNLIDVLVNKFFPAKPFRNDAIKCLTEIASLDIGEQYDQHFKQMFFALVPKVTEQAVQAQNQQGAVQELQVSSSSPLGEAHGTMSEPDIKFTQDLCMFIAAFCRHHLHVVESEPSLHPHLVETLGILVQISKTDDMETFKICLEYWQWLGSNLYSDMSSPGSQLVDALVLAQGQPFSRDNPWEARRQLYAPVLSKARAVMITKMARPEEVLIVQDENDPESIIQEVMKDTDAIMLYKSMRETLIYLTNLDVEDTEQIMQETLRRQVDGSAWDWNTLNTLCWAIGSISGAMTEEDEKRFLVLVIKELLGLCEKKKGKENKAVIASNIMYVVGQYPRFLRQHWKFLKTVVNKLFEFMHEPHPGVQDMACETFLKISEKCKRKFVTPQIPPDPRLFIDELLSDIDKHTSDFPQPHQTQTFYEAVGHMVSAEPDMECREQLVVRLCKTPNGIWAEIMRLANESGGTTLQDPATMKNISKILRTNQRVASSVGHSYGVQLMTIYEQALKVYQAYSDWVSAAVSEQGQQATTHHHVRSMRSVRKDTLKLIETYVSLSKDPLRVAQIFVSPLLEPVIANYGANNPDAREPEVLSLLTCVVNTCRESVLDGVPQMLAPVFQSTIEMITANFEDHPEIRLNFYLLIEAINKHCFPALVALSSQSPDVFKTTVNSIMWAFKHTERNIGELGLSICKELLQKIHTTEIGQAFYKEFFGPLLQDVFAVLTDTLHKTGFKLQVRPTLNLKSNLSVALFCPALPRLTCGLLRAVGDSSSHVHTGGEGGGHGPAMARSSPRRPSGLPEQRRLPAE